MVQALLDGELVRPLESVGEIPAPASDAKGLEHHRHVQAARKQADGSWVYRGTYACTFDRRVRSACM